MKGSENDLSTEYLHGTDARFLPSQIVSTPNGIGTIPVYIGTSPEGDVNEPYLLSTFGDTEFSIGYSDDWGKYTLSEVVAAHFRNPQENAGPIIVINVWDPDKHEFSTPTTEEIIEGVKAARKVNARFNIIPSILAAPGWSDDRDVYQAMVDKSTKLNGHYDLVVFADLDSKTTRTIEQAIAWKDTSGYNSHRSKVFWPMSEFSGRKYHASTLAIVRSMILDLSQDNCPCETPSNKPTLCSRMILNDGELIEFDTPEANLLNAEGITTFNFSGGEWVLWGPHNANFKHGVTKAPDMIFDTGIRVMFWLGNGFQFRHARQVDMSMARSRVDRIIKEEQMFLSALVVTGRLLYGRIEFIETSNPISDIVQGNFIFDSSITTTPIGKSLIVQLQYTAEGLNTLYGNGGETE